MRRLMPEPCQAMLKPADQDDRDRENREIPGPRDSPARSILTKRNRGADDHRQTEIFERQVTKIREVIDLAEPGNFRLKLARLEA